MGFLFTLRLNQADISIIEISIMRLGIEGDMFAYFVILFGSSLHFINWRKHASLISNNCLN